MNALARHYALIFVLGFGYRLFLLWLFPALYGGDSIGRLYYREAVFFSHWLPFLQAVIVAVFKVSHSVFATRLVVIVMNSVAAIAFYEFVKRMSGVRAGLIAGLLFTFCPLFVYLSLVPYQEIIFLGFLLGGLTLMFEDETSRKVAGFACYGLACLTRYEAWYLLPVLFFMQMPGALRAGDRASQARQILSFSLGLIWAPTLWMVMNKLHFGEFTAFLFHKQGTVYFWQPHNEFLRLARYLRDMVGWLFKYGSPLALFAIPGFFYCRKARSHFFPPFLALVLLTGIQMLFLMFIASREFSNVVRFAALPLSVLLVLCALGISQAYDWLFARRLPWTAGLFLVAAFAGLAIYAAVPIARASNLPENRLAYDVSQFLKEELEKDEAAIVLAPGFRDYPDAVPMPCQRIGAQFDDAADRLFCAAALPVPDARSLVAFGRKHNVGLMVQFEHFEPWRTSDAVIMNFLQRDSEANAVVWEKEGVRITRVKSWRFDDVKSKSSFAQ